MGRERLEFPGHLRVGVLLLLLLLLLLETAQYLTSLSSPQNFALQAAVFKKVGTKYVWHDKKNVTSLIGLSSTYKSGHPTTYNVSVRFACPLPTPTHTPCNPHHSHRLRQSAPLSASVNTSYQCAAIFNYPVIAADAKKGIKAAVSFVDLASQPFIPTDQDAFSSGAQASAPCCLHPNCACALTSTACSPPSTFS